MKLSVTANNINLQIELTPEQVLEVVENYKNSNITTNVDKFKTFKDIKSFEDVLLYLGKDITKKYGKFKKIRLIYKAFQKITNFIVDYSDTNQRKYYSWFRYDSSTKRFVFYASYCATTFSGTGVRFLLPSEEISNYVGKQFINEFNDILL